MEILQIVKDHERDSTNYPSSCKDTPIYPSSDICRYYPYSKALTEILPMSKDPI